MNKRTAAYPIEPLLLNRRSLRALSEQEITRDELMTLFEAARWAPSSYNNQPWRFVYALRNTPAWQIFLDLLVPANKVWAQKGAALIVVTSHRLFSYNNKPSRTHSFDTGAACENMALQGHAMGLVIHGMEGFSYERARVVLHIPQEYDVEAMFVVGKLGKIEELPEELQKSEEQPTDRRPIADCVTEGRW